MKDLVVKKLGKHYYHRASQTVCQLCLPNRHNLFCKNTFPQSTYWHLNSYVEKVEQLFVALKQACTTYGPRAKCGPRKLFIWPAKPKISSIQPVGLKNSLRMGTKRSILALGYAPKNIFGPLEIWVVHPWSRGTVCFT